MTPSLLLPSALAALAAFIIPLAIHIARRSAQLPTDFAALRWLRQKPRPRSRLRVDEWLLLALRLLILALCAFWLARPVLFGAADKSAYVAVIPGVDLKRADVPTKGTRLHWLTPGFPDLDPGQAAPPARFIPVASLLRQLDAELPTGTTLTVIVPQLISGADAERPRLSRKVTWQIVPVAMPALPPRPMPIPKLSIRSDAQHNASIRYLRAAALAWQVPGHPADLEAGGMDLPLPDTDRAVIWMGAGTLPTSLVEWIKKGGAAIVTTDALFPPNSLRAVLWADDLGRPLAEATPMGNGRLIRFTRSLEPKEMPELLEASFPMQLRVILNPPMPPPSRVRAADFAPSPGGKAYDQPPQDLRAWLSILIAATLLAERWFATRRRRAISP